MNVQHDSLLAPYTSLHVGGPAKTLIELTDADSLQDALSKASAPIYVLGYGTNTLVSDKGVDGTVIINRGDAIKQLSPTQLKVTSGVAWDDLVKKTIEQGLYGLEFTSGIPGGVGAAIVGNIAAYGQSVSDCLLGATILDITTGSITSWGKQAFEFSYRFSALQKPKHKNCLIIDATFELSKEPTSQLEYDSALNIGQKLGLEPNSLADRRAIIMETREQSGSLLVDNATGPWTAGSFFKNPVVNEDQLDAIIKHEETNISKDQLLRQNKIHGGSRVRVSAAHVLLAAGFKRGQTWGSVRFHPDHILKVENTGRATAQEIYEVIQEIIKTVHDKLAIDLEPEVRFLGEF
ncbi:MAG: UDP-N-acetylmuramate dehydrogenase [Candidatus Saccharibacteria bacterium]